MGLNLAALDLVAQRPRLLYAQRLSVEDGNMMGSKGSPAGIEIDALDRKGRRGSSFRPSQLRKIKRQFWKRERCSAEREIEGASRN